MAWKTLLFLLREEVSLWMPSYIPSQENLADEWSHLNDRGTWRMAPWVRHLLLHMLPSLAVDLFACSLSAALPQFFSCFPCPGTEGINAFTRVWNSPCWMVPPIGVLCLAVAKLIDSSVHAVCIVL